MKVVSLKLKSTLDALKVYVFSDWHIGDVSCDMARIRRQIEEVKNDECNYCILNGDLLNNATKTSVSDCYAESIPPMDQLRLAIELLEPIKDKILMATSGNHEARTYRNDGIDLMGLVTKQLGIYDRYCHEGGVLFLRFGERSGKKHYLPVLYSFYVTHGSGGGRKEGAKAIRLADMASVIDTDIYIHSHTHLPMIMKQGFFRTYYSRQAVEKVEKLFVNTAAQLEYGGYSQTYEYKPASKDNPIIYLNGTKKEFTAKL